jgi:hypothetical protein
MSNTTLFKVDFDNTTDELLVTIDGEKVVDENIFGAPIRHFLCSQKTKNTSNDNEDIKKEIDRFSISPEDKEELKTAIDSKGLRYKEGWRVGCDGGLLSESLRSVLMSIRGVIDENQEEAVWDFPCISKLSNSTSPKVMVIKDEGSNEGSSVPDDQIVFSSDDKSIGINFSFIESGVPTPEQSLFDPDHLTNNIGSLRYDLQISGKSGNIVLFYEIDNLVFKILDSKSVLELFRNIRIVADISSDKEFKDKLNELYFECVLYTLKFPNSQINDGTCPVVFDFSSSDNNNYGSLSSTFSFFGGEFLSRLKLKYATQKNISEDDVLLIEKVLGYYDLDLDLGDHENNQSLDANLEALESHAIKYRVNELKDAINKYSDFLGETYDRLISGDILVTDTDFNNNYVSLTYNLDLAMKSLCDIPRVLPDDNMPCLIGCVLESSKYKRSQDLTQQVKDKVKEKIGITDKDFSLDDLVNYCLELNNPNPNPHPKSKSKISTLAHNATKSFKKSIKQSIKSKSLKSSDEPELEPEFDRGDFSKGEILNRLNIYDRAYHERHDVGKCLSIKEDDGPEEVIRLPLMQSYFGGQKTLRKYIFFSRLKEIERKRTSEAFIKSVVFVQRKMKRNITDHKLKIIKEENLKTIKADNLKNKSAVKMQSLMRIYIAQQKVKTIKENNLKNKSIVRLQSFARKNIAINSLEKLKVKKESSVKIQSFVRSKQAVKHFEVIKSRRYKFEADLQVANAERDAARIVADQANNKKDLAIISMNESNASMQQAQSERGAAIIRSDQARLEKDLAIISMNDAQKQAQQAKAERDAAINLSPDLLKTIANISFVIERVKAKKSLLIKEQKLTQIRGYLTAISDHISPDSNIDNSNIANNNIDDINLIDTKHVYGVFSGLCYMFKYISSCFTDRGYTKSKTYQTVSPIKDAIRTQLDNSANDINNNKFVIKKALDRLVTATTAPAA